MSYRYINLDTRSRTNKNALSTDCVIKLPYLIKRVHKIEVISAEVPNTAYAFSAARGNTTINVDGNVYNIPDGNYDDAGIIKVLNDVSGISNTDLDEYSGTISMDGTNVSFPANADGSPSLGTYLGFTGTGAATDPVGTNVVNLLGETYYLIKISNDIRNMISVTADGAEISPSIFSKLVLRGTAFSIVADNEGISDTKVMTFKSPININQFQLGIYDYYGNVVNLNGAEYSITLRMTVIDDPYC